MALSQVKLAKALSLSRSTVQYYLARGMPAEVEEAKQWLVDWKGNKATVAAVPIPSSPAVGDTFEDRLARLRTSEKAICRRDRGRNQCAARLGKSVDRQR
jgi:hypothetical protein